MMNIYFQHGWGFDKSCWDKLLAEISGAKISMVDRGYLGKEKVNDNPFNSKGINLIVCHSLGLHLVPKSLLLECDLLFIIGGFKHYHGKTSQDGRFSRRHVKRMFKELEVNPVSLLEKFYNDCSYLEFNLADANLNYPLLKEDLELLDTQTFDLEILENIPKVILIHGKQDRVVPIPRGLDIANSLTNASFIEIEDGDHGLPYTHPKYCWQIIDIESKTYSYE